MSWRNRGRYWFEQYLINLAYLADIGLNVVLLAGDPRETLSSRIAKRALDGRVASRLMCRFLGWLDDDDHCLRAIHPEYGSRQVWQNPWRVAAFGLVVVALVVALYVYL